MEELAPGYEEDGYKYKGGDPADEASWEKLAEPQQAIQPPAINLPQPTYSPTETKAITRPQVGTTPTMTHPNALAPKIPVEEAPDRSGFMGIVREAIERPIYGAIVGAGSMPLESARFAENVFTQQGGTNEEAKAALESKQKDYEGFQPVEAHREGMKIIGRSMGESQQSKENSVRGAIMGGLESVGTMIGAMSWGLATGGGAGAAMEGTNLLFGLSQANETYEKLIQEGGVDPRTAALTAVADGVVTYGVEKYSNAMFANRFLRGMGVDLGEGVTKGMNIPQMLGADGWKGLAKSIGKQMATEVAEEEIQTGFSGWIRQQVGGLDEDWNNFTSLDGQTRLVLGTLVATGVMAGSAGTYQQYRGNMAVKELMDPSTDPVRRLAIANSMYESIKKDPDVKDLAVPFRAVTTDAIMSNQPVPMDMTLADMSQAISNLDAASSVDMTTGKRVIPDHYREAISNAVSRLNPTATPEVRAQAIKDLQSAALAFPGQTIYDQEGRRILPQRQEIKTEPKKPTNIKAQKSAPPTQETAPGTRPLTEWSSGFVTAIQADENIAPETKTQFLKLVQEGKREEAAALVGYKYAEKAMEKPGVFTPSKEEGVDISAVKEALSGTPGVFEKIQKDIGSQQAAEPMSSKDLKEWKRKTLELYAAEPLEPGNTAGKVSRRDSLRNLDSAIARAEAREAGSQGTQQSMGGEEKEISSNSKGLMAALTNPTELARKKGNLEKSYPITLTPENWGGKETRTFPDVEAAYQALKGAYTKGTGANSTFDLMTKLLKIKLQSHPELTTEITKRGGSSWILSRTHQPTSKNTVWETKGENLFVKALDLAYKDVAKVVEPTVMDERETRRNKIKELIQQSENVVSKETVYLMAYQKLLDKYWDNILAREANPVDPKLLEKAPTDTQLPMFENELNAISLISQLEELEDVIRLKDEEKARALADMRAGMEPRGNTTAIELLKGLTDNQYNTGDPGMNALMVGLENPTGNTVSRFVSKYGPILRKLGWRFTSVWDYKTRVYRTQPVKLRGKLYPSIEEAVAELDTEAFAKLPKDLEAKLAMLGKYMGVVLEERVSRKGNKYKKKVPLKEKNLRIGQQEEGLAGPVGPTVSDLVGEVYGTLSKWLTKNGLWSFMAVVDKYGTDIFPADMVNREAVLKAVGIWQSAQRLMYSYRTGREKGFWEKKYLKASKMKRPKPNFQNRFFKIMRLVDSEGIIRSTFVGDMDKITPERTAIMASMILDRHLKQELGDSLFFRNNISPKTREDIAEEKAKAAELQGLMDKLIDRSITKEEYARLSSFDSNALWYALMGGKPAVNINLHGAADPMLTDDIISSIIDPNNEIFRGQLGISLEELEDTFSFRDPQATDYGRLKEPWVEEWEAREYLEAVDHGMSHGHAELDMEAIREEAIGNEDNNLKLRLADLPDQQALYDLISDIRQANRTGYYQQMGRRKLEIAEKASTDPIIQLTVDSVTAIVKSEDGTFTSKALGIQESLLRLTAEQMVAFSSLSLPVTNSPEYQLALSMMEGSINQDLVDNFYFDRAVGNYSDKSKTRPSIDISRSLYKEQIGEDVYPKEKGGLINIPAMRWNDPENVFNLQHPMAQIYTKIKALSGPSEAIDRLAIFLSALSNIRSVKPGNEITKASIEKERKRATLYSDIFEKLYSGKLLQPEVRKWGMVLALPERAISDLLGIPVNMAVNLAESNFDEVLKFITRIGIQYGFNAVPRYVNKKYVYQTSPVGNITDDELEDILDAVLKMDPVPSSTKEVPPTSVNADFLGQDLAYDHKRMFTRGSRIINDVLYNRNREILEELYNSTIKEGKGKDWKELTTSILGGWKEYNEADTNYYKSEMQLINKASGRVQRIFSQSSEGTSDAIVELMSRIEAMESLLEIDLFSRKADQIIAGQPAVNPILEIDELYAVAKDIADDEDLSKEGKAKELIREALIRIQTAEESHKFMKNSANITMNALYAAKILMHTAQSIMTKKIKKSITSNILRDMAIELAHVSPAGMVEDDIRINEENLIVGESLSTLGRALGIHNIRAGNLSVDNVLDKNTMLAATMRKTGIEKALKGIPSSYNLFFATVRELAGLQLGDKNEIHPKAMTFINNKADVLARLFEGEMFDQMVELSRKMAQEETDFFQQSMGLAVSDYADRMGMDKDALSRASAQTFASAIGVIRRITGGLVDITMATPEELALPLIHERGLSKIEAKAAGVIGDTSLRMTDNDVAALIRLSHEQTDSAAWNTALHESYHAIERIIQIMARYAENTAARNSFQALMTRLEKHGDPESRAREFAALYEAKMSAVPTSQRVAKNLLTRMLESIKALLQSIVTGMSWRQQILTNQVKTFSVKELLDFFYSGEFSDYASGLKRTATWNEAKASYKHMIREVSQKSEDPELKKFMEGLIKTEDKYEPKTEEDFSMGETYTYGQIPAEEQRREYVDPAREVSFIYSAFRAGERIWYFTDNSEPVDLSKNFELMEALNSDTQQSMVGDIRRAIRRALNHPNLVPESIYERISFTHLGNKNLRLKKNANIADEVISRMSEITRILSGTWIEGRKLPNTGNVEGPRLSMSQAAKIRATAYYHHDVFRTRANTDFYRALQARLNSVPKEVFLARDENVMWTSDIYDEAKAILEAVFEFESKLASNAEARQKMGEVNEILRTAYADLGQDALHLQIINQLQDTYQSRVVTRTEGKPWKPGKNVAVGDVFSDSLGRLYRALQGGVTGEVQPDGVGLRIQDGTVVWRFVQQDPDEMLHGLGSFRRSTGHAIRRTYRTIGDAWRHGYKVANDDIANNFKEYADEVSVAIENNLLLRDATGRGLRGMLPDAQPAVNERGELIFSVGEPIHTRGGQNYQLVDNPNFYIWDRIEEDQFIRNDTDFKQVRAATGEVMFFKKKNVYIHPDYHARFTGIIEPNSPLRRNVYFRWVLRVNAEMKRIILSSSLFHVFAFVRQYWFGTPYMFLGSRAKEFRREYGMSMNPFKGWKSGYRLIKMLNEGTATRQNMTPSQVVMLEQLETLMENGLTLGTIQDWGEIQDLRKRESVFTRAANSTTGKAKDIMQNIEGLVRANEVMLFKYFGNGLKVMSALAMYSYLQNKATTDMELAALTPEQREAKLAGYAAEFANANFGGLNLERYRNDKNPLVRSWFSPVMSDFKRLAFLAPDWTESNLIAMKKLLGTLGSEDKYEKAAYQFFARALLARGVTTILLTNLLVALIASGADYDDDDAWERLTKGWIEGDTLYERIKGIAEPDITPLYRLLGGTEKEVTKRYNVIGHFMDNIKVVVDTGGFLRGKLGVVPKSLMDFFYGSNYKGETFTTFDELFGIDYEKGRYSRTTGTHKKGDPKWGKYQYEPTKFGEGRPVSYDTLVSYMLYEMKSVGMPIQMQELLNVMFGYSGWFEAIPRMILGQQVSSEYLPKKEAPGLAKLMGKKDDPDRYINARWMRISKDWNKIALDSATDGKHIPMKKKVEFRKRINELNRERAKLGLKPKKFKTLLEREKNLFSKPTPGMPGYQDWMDRE